MQSHASNESTRAAWGKRVALGRGVAGSEAGSEVGSEDGAARVELTGVSGASSIGSGVGGTGVGARVGKG